MAETANSTLIERFKAHRAAHPEPAPTVKLFQGWCGCVRWQAPAHFPKSEARHAARLNSDLRAELVYKIHAAGDADEQSKAARLWISALADARSPDLANPCLPGERSAPARRLVMQLAARFPALAQAAGIAAE